jgi:hypothetical protein
MSHSSNRWRPVAATALAAFALAAVACGGDDRGQAAGRIETSTSTTATSAPSVEDQLKAALTVRATSVSVKGGKYDRALDVEFVIENRSPRTINVFQVSVNVRVTDRLGRVFSRNLLFDCTESPLGAGERRDAGETRHDIFAESDRKIAGHSNCTIGSWELNEFIDEEIGMYHAIDEGSASARADVTLNRIVFGDGSAIGKAEKGRL